MPHHSIVSFIVGLTIADPPANPVDKFYFWVNIPNLINKLE